MERNDELFSIPVVLIIYRRLDTVKLILDEIEKIKPSRFYIFSDGARLDKKEEVEQVKKVREYVLSRVTWKCDFITDFAEQNMGCAKRITSGLYKVFQQEESAIIFEDDAVPKQQYFFYCKELLDRYKEDKRIHYIAGFNFVGENACIQESYSFSFLGGLSGAFATWADRWNECDFMMQSWNDVKKSKFLKQYFQFDELYRVYSNALEDSYKQINDGWDYQFQYDGMRKERLAIVPKGNLAESYGYAAGAFHEQEDKIVDRLKRNMGIMKGEYQFPMKHPQKVVLDMQYERIRQKVALEVTGNYFERHLRYAKVKIKDFIYPIYAKVFK